MVGSELKTMERNWCCAAAVLQDGQPCASWCGEQLGESKASNSDSWNRPEPGGPFGSGVALLL